MHMMTDLSRNKMFLNLEKAWEDRNLQKIIDVLKVFVDESGLESESPLYKMFFESRNPDLETFLLLMWGLDIRPKFMIAFR